MNERSLADAMRPMAQTPSDHLRRRMNETTWLPPEQEALFRQWAQDNGITDVDHPDSYYDYRGYWKQTGGAPTRFGQEHFTDTYKQYGHPTFSVESQYARPGEGGVWVPGTEQLVPQPPMAVSHKRR